MNTISSVYYGWGFLILCGGGSYYFAKKSVTKDRYERKAMENDRRYRQSQVLEAAHHSSANSPPNATGREGGDPEPESKFEARRPFRTPKGDRFS